MDIDLGVWGSLKDLSNSKRKSTQQYEYCEKEPTNHALLHDHKDDQEIHRKRLEINRFCTTQNNVCPTLEVTVLVKVRTADVCDWDCGFCTEHTVPKTKRCSEDFGRAHIPAMPEVFTQR
mmetsp:Transcript_13690/g.31826  ORF Transcript_13690/g.31826 Transcript_13690/m.31826 type:complete len:120 (+) Transcript_13690:1166-1525(+)